MCVYLDEKGVHNSTTRVKTHARTKDGGGGDGGVVGIIWCEIFSNE